MMEKVFLAGIYLKNGERKLADTLNSMQELSRLTETAGGIVVGQNVQQLDKMDPSTLLGKGKVKELELMARKKEFTALIIDEELRPAQQKNLGELIPAKILDRTRLILDIFARRARSAEGILQVELAQLSYMLPRITERYGTFEQQVGGIGTRGPGERKLEVESRHIRDRISLLKREIDMVKSHRDLVRQRRQEVPMPVVTILGYTNAGKSTLLNQLVKLHGHPKEMVYSDDKLFATLDPTTRRIKLPSGRWALFTDTVGFINKLPHHLVAAFRSTLEETIDADLLIQLADAADPNLLRQTQTVTEILQSLVTEGKSFYSKRLMVYNKMDQVQDDARHRIAQNQKLLSQATTSGAAPPLDPLHISAHNGQGLNELLVKVEEFLTRDMIETEIFIPYKKSNIIESLYQLGRVENVTHLSRGTRLKIRLVRAHWEKMQKMLLHPEKED